MQADRTISYDIHKEFGLDKRKNVCTSERKISSFTKFNISLQQRNTRAQTGNNMQVLRDWRKWGHTISANEIKTEEGIKQTIKNNTDTPADCKE